MRVVFISPVGVIGGAERVLLDLMASLKATNPALDLSLIAAAPGPLLDQAARSGVRAILLEFPQHLAQTGDTRLSLNQCVSVLLATTTGVNYLRRLAATLRALRPDVVHANGIKAQVFSALATPRRTRLVWHLHDFLASRPNAGRVLRLVVRYRRPDVAIAISRAVATDASRVLPKVPVAVVPNGINTAHFTPGPGDGPLLDRLAGWNPAPAGTIRVGLVATYARWKGHDIVIEAAARLADMAMRWYLVGGPVYRTAGSQFSREELAALAASRQMADRVGFLPFQPDPVTIYRSLDVVIHASTKPEPFGLTIIEAMACGRPVIVSQAGGAAELFTSGEEALGVPPGDAAALAAAVRTLVMDPGLSARLGIAARRRAVAEFDRGRLGPTVLSIYTHLMTTPRYSSFFFNSPS